MSIRKALVNDIVHSFCYAIRSNKQWPVVILGNKYETTTAHSFPLQALIPFTNYAYSKQRNYILANRHIILIASWLRAFSTEEQQYAVTLMQKYYGYNISTTETSQQDNQPQLRGHEQQELSEATELRERN